MARAKLEKNHPFSADNVGLFRAIWGTASEAMVLFDRDGTVIEANPALLNLAHLGREEAVGRDISLIFAPDFVSVVREHFTEQPDHTETPATYETTVERLDGETRVLEVSVTFLEANGTRVAGLVIGRNVTARKQVELALRTSEEKYRTLVQNLPNGSIHLFDRNLTIVVAGGSGFSKPGIEPREATGKSIYEVLPAEVTQQAATAYHEVLEGKTIVAEITLGDQLFEVHFVPVTDDQGDVTCGLVLAQDITIRKRIELEADRRVAIVKSSNEAIFGTTPDGTIYHWNPAAEKLYGYPAGEAIGLNASMLIPPDHPDELPALLEQVASGEKVEAYDTVCIRNDGRRLDISVSVSPVLDALGRFCGASTIAHDITERKVTERAIKGYAIRQTDLLQQVMTAQEDERRRLAMDLHDGPLQSLAISLMALERANFQTDQGAPDMAKQELAFAHGVIDGITEDIRSMLANLSAERLAEQGLAAGLRQHAEMVSEGSDLQVTVVNTVQERLPLELEILLYRLMQEALANVGKHARAKNVAVNVRKEIHDEIAGLLLDIKDDGIGFDPEIGLKRNREGSSLGLRSMQQRIKSAGGDMKITSASGEGTTVEFWCPI